MGEVEPQRSICHDESATSIKYAWQSSIGEVKPLKGGTGPETIEIGTHICSCHNFPPLSSVQILLIPACCLLCVL